jgi:hypothetical protein
MDYENVDRLIKDLKELVQAMDGGVILKPDMPEHTKELICGMLEFAHSWIESKNKKELN